MSKDHIFVCYSSKDRKYADSLVAQATQLNKNKLWVSHIDSIQVGENYKNYIKDKIENSTGAILLVSKSFLDSDFINNIELPYIFEQKKKNKNYKIVISLVEDCNYQNNTYLVNKHMINSKSTALGEISTRQYDLIVKEILEEFPSTFVNKQKINVNYLMPATIIFSIIFFGIVFFMNSGTNEENVNEISSTPTTSIAISEGIDNSIANEPECIVSTLNNSYIEGNKGKWALNDFWNNQSIWGPQSIDENLTNLVGEDSFRVLPCNDIHEAEILYRDTIPFIPTGDDGTLNYDELSEVRANNFKKCYANFEAKYEFGFKTEFEIKVLFLKSDLTDKVDLYCLVVKKETGSGSWMKWAYPLSDFDFKQYSSVNLIQSKKIRDLSIGDCVLYENWWSTSKNPYNPEENILDRSISKIPCYQPHDYEVIAKFEIPVEDKRTELEKDYFASSVCQDSTRIHKDFDSSEEDLDYWFLTDLTVNYEDANTFICLAGPYGEFDTYKTNISLRERLSEKIYQSNLGVPGETFFTIDNCPTSLFENEDFKWEFSWGNLDQPFNFLQIIFSDEVSPVTLFLSSEHNPIFSELINWSTEVEVYFEKSQNLESQKAFVFATISFGNESLVASCNNIDILDEK